MASGGGRMRLRTASWLGRYRLLQDFTGGANCRWTFAESDGREYFVKEFQRPKYPPDDLPQPAKTLRLARCYGFEERHRRLLAAIRKADNSTGALTVPVEFFRHELSYYDVAHADRARTPGPMGTLPFCPVRSRRKRLAKIRGLARGVLALHSERVVHGDLKPSNVLIDRGCTGELARAQADRFRQRRTSRTSRSRAGRHGVRPGLHGARSACPMCDGCPTRRPRAWPPMSSPLGC